MMLNRLLKGPVALPFLLAILICSTSLFYFLGGYGLLDNNEGLYAQIGREMTKTGNYIIPSLNGLPYLEKPPLLYWLISSLFHIFGTNETAARCVPAMSAFLGLFFIYSLLKKVFSRITGITAFLILGTSLGYIAFARTLLFDMLFTTCLTGALCSLFNLCEKKTVKSVLSFYLFLAFAVLAKGLVGLVLTGLIWTTYFLVEGRRHISFWHPLSPTGLVLFLTITAPWHVAAHLQEDSFAWFYFINEHFLRFLGQREPHDYYEGPVYYYTYRIFLYFIPWTLITPFLIRQKMNFETSSQRRLFFFMTSWFISVFIFFSISKAKANYYLVTLMPPAAVLFSLYFNEKLSERTHRWIYGTGYSILTLLSLIFLAIFVFQKMKAPFPLSLDIPQNLWMSGVLGLCIVCICQILKKYKTDLWSVFPLSSLPIVLLFAGTRILPLYEDQLSQKKMALQALQTTKGPFLIYREYEAVSSLRFYLPSDLRIVDSISQDLLFAQQQEPAGKHFLTREMFKEQGGFIFVRKNREAEFMSYFPMATKILERSQGKVALYHLQSK